MMKRCGGKPVTEKEAAEVNGGNGEAVGVKIFIASLRRPLPQGSGDGSHSFSQRVARDIPLLHIQEEIEQAEHGASGFPGGDVLMQRQHLVTEGLGILRVPPSGGCLWWRHPSLPFPFFEEIARIANIVMIPTRRHEVAILELRSGPCPPRDRRVQHPLQAIAHPVPHKSRVGVVDGKIAGKRFLNPLLEMERVIEHHEA